MITMTARKESIVDTNLEGDHDSTKGSQNNIQFGAVCKTQEDFVSRVIFDGRYLDTFTEQPELTAERIGVTINPAIADQMRGRDPMPILSATTSHMTEERAMQKTDALPYHPEMGYGLGAIVVMIVIDRTAEPACNCPVNPCEDLSDDADEKL